MKYPCHSHRPRRARTGFSLIEILIVLALIALVGGLVVTNTDALMRGLGPPPLPRTLTKAVREARYHAAADKVPTLLRFDHEAGVFLISDDAGNEKSRLESGYGEDNPRVSVTFLRLVFERGADADVFDGRIETEEVDAVRFLPDRSATPFVAEVEVEGERSRHRFDTFSDIELKPDR